jgi:hypothetical protein
MDDPGSRALSYGQRAIDEPSARVTEDRVTGSRSLALARSDDGGFAETAGGSGATTSVRLPSPWPPRLDAKLAEVGAHDPLRAGIEIVASLSRFKGMAFSVADFTSSGTRAYASSHDKEQRFIASTAKLAILFAVFQLRKALREAAVLVTDAKVTQDTQLFQAVMRQWGPKIGRYFHGSKGSDDSLPSLSQIFKGTQRGSGGWEIAFADTPRGGTGRAFTDRLMFAIRYSDDEEAGSCIRDLGFPYIHGCMAEAGIWKRGRGLWVALDYAGHLWWPETANEVGSAQACTARSLVELMTLLEFDELVPGSRAEMRDLLAGVRPGTSFASAISYVKGGIEQALSHAEFATLDVRSKVGFTGANTHCDAAIVSHDSKAGNVRYAVAVLNAVDANTAQAAARDVDVVLIASHLPQPPASP